MTGDPLDHVAGEVDDGRRLDQALAHWLGEPRSRVQRRLREGEVLVDGEPAAKSHRVRAGERVRVRPGPQPSVPDPPRVPVRYEDEHVAVVAKPAGLVVHPGAGMSAEPTLVDALRAGGVGLADGGEPDRPGIVHRLDRGTSGLLVVAKTPTAHTALVGAFSGHEVDRAYWALVEGVPRPARASVEAPIARSDVRRTRFAVDPGGRPALSHYDVLEDHTVAAAVEVRLETGRTHQVRVHMSSIGHPVVADAAYGASTALARRLGLGRPALHAALLGFAHPVTGERVEVVEPLPEDLADALERLRGAEAQ